jgi:translation initiation factor IF-2
VDVRLHRIIYKVIEEIEAAMKGMLDPEFQEKIIGQAEIRQTFKVSKVGTIAGSYVTDGKITRDSGIRLIRNGVVIFEGQIDALKRFKDDAKEVAQGYECGITIKNFNDVKEGDIIEAYVMEEVERK